MRPDESIALMSIVAAYSIVFAAIFIFVWSMISRQKNLEKRLRDLQEEIHDSSRK